ncbi:MAG: hypothetical protein HYS12_14565 [Planctomycetes bacterium]|nr:hypothetical protein [Planctomycetota bacterium]
MRRVTSRRLAVCAALAVCACPVLLAAPRPEKPVTFTGKVVPLAGLVEKLGSKLDADAVPHWLALVTDDGKVYPLIKDGGSRMFFKDKALLNRPMRLTGRLLPGSQLLQVIEVHSLRRGKLHEVYYWCNVCSIRRSEKNACECCGGPMELKEEPVGR